MVTINKQRKGIKEAHREKCSSRKLHIEGSYCLHGPNNKQPDSAVEGSHEKEVESSCLATTLLTSESPSPEEQCSSSGRPTKNSAIKHWN